MSSCSFHFIYNMHVNKFIIKSNNLTFFSTYIINNFPSCTENFILHTVFCKRQGGSHTLLSLDYTACFDITVFKRNTRIVTRHSNMHQWLHNSLLYNSLVHSMGCKTLGHLDLSPFKYKPAFSTLYIFQINSPSERMIHSNNIVVLEYSVAL
jgi:hypothetical protein